MTNTEFIEVKKIDPPLNFTNSVHLASMIVTASHFRIGPYHQLPSILHIACPSVHKPLTPIFLPLYLNYDVNTLFGHQVLTIAILGWQATQYHLIPTIQLNLGRCPLMTRFQ